jgi:molybdopterin synthase sulfur carrier subunit
MKIQVRYFASLREALGAGELLEVPDDSTLHGLREWLLQRSARHAEVLARHRPVRCALDQRIRTDDPVLAEGAEVAFFPPVTGG